MRKSRPWEKEIASILVIVMMVFGMPPGLFAEEETDPEDTQEVTAQPQAETTVDEATAEDQTQQVTAATSGSLAETLGSKTPLSQAQLDYEKSNMLQFKGTIKKVGSNFVLDRTASGMQLMVNGQPATEDYFNQTGTPRPGVYTDLVTADPAGAALFEKLAGKTVTITRALAQTTSGEYVFIVTSINGIAIDKLIKDPTLLDKPSDDPDLVDPNDIKPYSLDTALITQFPGDMKPASISSGKGGATDEGKVTARGIQITYNTGDAEQGGWAGGGFIYDDDKTEAVETGDLSKLTTLRFGLKGDATSVQMAVIDATGKQAIVRLTGIKKDTEQVWSIPAELLKKDTDGKDMDLSKIRLIYFIVEGTNATGVLEINNKSTANSSPSPSPSSSSSPNPSPSPSTSPGQAIQPYGSSTAVMVSLPNSSTKAAVSASYLAPKDSKSKAEATSRGIKLNYETGTGDDTNWAAAGFSYDDDQTEDAYESADISKLDYLYFSLKGDPGSVVLQVTDDKEKTAMVELSGIKADSEQVYRIPTSQLSGIDLTKVVSMFFVVAGDNIKGSFEVAQGALITADSTTNLAKITTLPKSSDNREISGSYLAPQGSESKGDATARGIKLHYVTKTDSWAGVGFTYDDEKTANTAEYANFSSLSELKFGLKGNPSTIRFEIKDADGRTAVLYLSGIVPGSEKVLTIPTALISKAVDVSKISSIYFIVEGQNLTGDLEVNHVKSGTDTDPSPSPSPSSSPYPSPSPSTSPNPSPSPSSSSDPNLPAAGTVTDKKDPPVQAATNKPVIPLLPFGNEGQVIGMTAVGPVSVEAKSITRGVHFDFDLKADLTWAGPGFAYDDFTTKDKIETGDLSKLESLIFGLKGDAGQVKLEIVDDKDRKVSLLLTGIKADEEKVFSIPTELIEKAVDLKHVRLMYFIVEMPAGQTTSKGALEVYNIPSLSSASTDPKTISVYPKSRDGRDVSLVTFAPKDSKSTSAEIDRGVKLNFITATGDNSWSATGLYYDKDDTKDTIETGDLSKLSALRIGLKGTTPRVKVEIKDNKGRVATVALEGISSTEEKVWAIPASLLSPILDLSNIQMVLFVVEGENLNGSLELTAAPKS